MASVGSPALRVTVRQASRISNTSDHRVCVLSVNGSSSAITSTRQPACVVSSVKRLNRSETWSDWRKCGSKKLRQVVASHSLRRRGSGMRQSRIVSEMAGQYEESFSDVDKVREWLKDLQPIGDKKAQCLASAELTRELWASKIAQTAFPSLTVRT